MKRSVEGVRIIRLGIAVNGHHRWLDHLRFSHKITERGAEGAGTILSGAATGEDA